MGIKSQRVKGSKGQRVKESKSQRVKGSKGQRVKESKSQRVKESRSQRVKKKPIPTPPYERRAEANRVGERLAARRCVIIANLLRCYRIRAWSSPPQRVAVAVCHNSQSAPLLSDSDLVKSAAGGSLFLEAWHTLQEERRADASTPGSASRQGAWLTPRRAKATESPPRRADDERRVTFCVVLQPGRSWKGRAGQRRIGEERFPAAVPCSPRW